MSKYTLHFGTETIELPGDVDVMELISKIERILAGTASSPFLHLDAPGYDQWLLITPATHLRITEREVRTSGRTGTII
ncbi:hypothetical protein C5C18_08290 [Rathayibacter tritici]|uniref:hypothetical protein n=1 Tax=Rathayibacter tritici TaxID=33888 RepID=UPI000CE8A5B3|nr:hypothetical protein [Rathayibacter tritici]PPF68431.1 hypothetical protein C5C21_05345 [Rathayibacter tritici]PPG07242.1 hypothetical protein C5C18_08290 [Rathayibacter tritici]